MSDRDELIVGVLGLRRASDAVLLAGNLIDNAKVQAEAEVKVKAAEAEADFRRINGLGAVVVRGHWALMRQTEQEGNALRARRLLDWQGKRAI